MTNSTSSGQALLEPTSEPSSAVFDDVEDDFSKSTAKSYWYLQVLVLGFLLLHLYTVVMLVICPLGSTGNSSLPEGLGVDGYGQCLHGGVVPTPWSTTSPQGWLNVTVDVSSDGNPGWWKGVVLIAVFVVSLFFFVGSYSKASWSDPGYVMHLSKHEEVRACLRACARARVRVRCLQCAFACVCLCLRMCVLRERVRVPVSI
jgi:hypothetical protein